MEQDIIFHLKNALKEDIGTKILPEAYTWHFAGTWIHIKELVKGSEGKLENNLKKSILNGILYYK